MLRLIDCTLRDGGYHNSWNFSKGFAEKTIRTLALSGINDIEIGFRKPSIRNLLNEGTFANCTSQFIEGLEIPGTVLAGLMINVSDYENNGKIDLELIKKSFPSKENKLSFIRIAANNEQIFNLQEAIGYLENLGYEVHLNLMKINSMLSGSSFNSKGSENIEAISELGIKHLTLADTYGVLRPRELGKILEEFQKIRSVNLGLHMHNNFGLATSNSLLGLDYGIEMLDSTLTGMGRGPGNLRTEFIVDEIQSRNDSKKYNSTLLLNYAAEAYEPLKDYHKWGESAFYNLGSKNLIHPSYVQYLTSNGDYSATEIIEAINFLGTKKKLQYSEEYISFVLNEKFAGPTTVSTNYLERNLGKDRAIIFGAGDTTKDFLLSSHELLSKVENQMVVSLTLRPEIDQMLIDTYVISDPVKYQVDYKLAESFESLIVTPFNLRKVNGQRPSNFVYPLKISSEGLDSSTDQACLPYPSSLGYALMFLVSIGVRFIQLVGFDGFSENDSRQVQNQQILDLFQKKYGHYHEISFLTPTKYKFDS